MRNNTLRNAKMRASEVGERGVIRRDTQLAASKQEKSRTPANQLTPFRSGFHEMVRQAAL